MPVKVKAAIDKVKAAIDKVKAAESIEKVKAADLPGLVTNLEEYQSNEEQSIVKVKAAIKEIKEVLNKVKADSSERVTIEEIRDLISILNEVDNDEIINLIHRFGNTNGISLDHDPVADKSLQELRLENAAWRRIVTKLQLEVDALEQNGN